MSIVIIGGHERMETQYKDICKKYKCKAKVFTKMKTDLKNKIGNPDLMILFTSTASHKMVHCAVAEAERNHVLEGDLRAVCIRDAGLFFVPAAAGGKPETQSETGSRREGYAAGSSSSMFEK